MIRRTHVLVFLAAGLAIAAAALQACGGGGGYGSSPTMPSSPSSPPQSEVVTVDVVDNHYEPQSVTIQPGQTVRWVMRGQDRSHTVTARDGAFDSGFAFQRAGDVFEHTFGDTDNGMTFEYYCQSHQGCCRMQGSVRVGNDAPAPEPGY
jgi:plastocyanin